MKLWAGDPLEAAIVRKQEDQLLECKAPEFKQYVCLTYTDLKKVYETLLKCRDWGTETKLMKLKHLAKQQPQNTEIILDSYR